MKRRKRRSEFPYRIPGVSVYRRGDAGPRAAWLAAYYLNGKRVVGEKLSADTAVARKLAERISTMVLEGKTDPRAARYAQMDQRPLYVDREDGSDTADQPGEASHLADYHAVLLAEDNTPKHCEAVIWKARRVFKAAGINRISEMLPGPIQVAIAGLKDKRRSGRKSRLAETYGEKLGASAVPISLQSRNHYLRAVKQTTAWLAGQEKRAAEDPLKHLKTWNVDTDRRHDRQDLREDGLAKLLNAARTGPDRMGLTGPARAMLYETAAESGLRANELRTLTPRRCELTGEHPILRIKAGHSKHREEDEQPIDPVFAAKLAKYIESLPLDEPIWNVPDKASDMIEFDIERAGLLYVDEEGRIADFHALRHTYINRLVRSGVDPYECQELARHASIETTMKFYKRLRLHDRSRAVRKLRPIPQDQAAQATRTDDRSANRSAQVSLRGPSQSLRDAEHPSSQVELKMENSGRNSKKRELERTHLAGLEPATFGSVDRRSIQLS